MGLIPTTNEQLEQAAEQTIGAAAAALLWAGEDSYGVLAHVAATSAPTMVQSRQAYAVLASARDFLDSQVQQSFDDELHHMAQCMEVAGLPATAVPSWAMAVSAALGEANRDMDADSYSDHRGIVMCHPDPARRQRSAAGYVKYQALLACSCWGRDPLPLTLIEALAHIVSVSTGRSPAARFYSSSP